MKVGQTLQPQLLNLGTTTLLSLSQAPQLAYRVAKHEDPLPAAVDVLGRPRRGLLRRLGGGRRHLATRRTGHPGGLHSGWGLWAWLRGEVEGWDIHSGRAGGGQGRR
jgi:hypothetical protein